MFGWLFKPDKTVIEIIEEQVDKGLLFRFLIDPIDKILSEENIYIYSCRMDQLKNITCPILELKDVKIMYLKNSVCISDQSTIIFITTNSINGTIEILEFISDTFSDKIENIKEKIEIASYHLSRVININTKKIDKIRDNFINVILNNDSIDIYLKLIPNKIIHGNPAQLSDIPISVKNKVPIITRIRIYIDGNTMINSVVLYSETDKTFVHPNADCGWYCLGNFKGKELNDENVLGLINSIKVMNINDCYFVPDYLKFYIKQE